MFIIFAAPSFLLFELVMSCREEEEEAAAAAKSKIKSRTCDSPVTTLMMLMKEKRVEPNFKSTFRFESDVNVFIRVVSGARSGSLIT